MWKVSNVIIRKMTKILSNDVINGNFTHNNMGHAYIIWTHELYFTNSHVTSFYNYFGENFGIPSITVIINNFEWE